MNYPWLEDFILSLPGCSKDYQQQWRATRYFVGGKMFAYAGEDNNGRGIITLKLDPMDGAALRERYPDVTPGYYANKLHWSSVDLNGAVPDEVFRQILLDSRETVFRALPGKIRREILQDGGGERQP